MRRLVLVEAYPPGFTVGHDEDVFSLTPAASYWLERHRQPYRIIPDLGSEQRFREREDRFWEEQLRWLAMVDDVLHAQVPALKQRGVRPAVLYGYYVKHVLDEVFMRGLEGLSVLDETRYDQVRLWTAREDPLPRPLRFTLPLEERSIQDQLWPLLCRSRGLAYEERLVPARQGMRLTHELHRHAAPSVRWLRGRCREAAWLLERWRGLRHPAARLTFCLLETNDDLVELLRRALRTGHRCFVRRGDHVLDLSRHGRCVMRLGAAAPDDPAVRQWNRLAETIWSSTSPIWQWPDGWFGCSLAPLLAEYFRSWMTTELATLVPRSDQFHAWYVRDRVDLAITSVLAAPSHVAAVAACHRPGARTRSVLVSHGDGPDDAKAWDLFEMAPYHHYCVSSEELADYFRRPRAFPSYHPLAAVHVGSYRWRQYARLSRARQRSARWRRPGSARPLVVYVIGRPDVQMRYLNKPEYSETWYYRLQTAIIRRLAQRTDSRCIVKLFPGAQRTRTVAEELLTELGARHIRISRKPFAYWLQRADRVILDIPSTPLYETSLAGVSFLVLIHRSFPMRPQGLAPFRSSVAWFETPEEAVRLMDQYLSRPAVSRPLLVPDERDLLTTLSALNGHVESREPQRQEHVMSGGAVA